VPRTVLSGFMTGIGGIICSLQLPVLLGHSGGAQVVQALSKLPGAVASPNLAALSIGLLTFGVLYKLPGKLTLGIPRPLLALLTASVTCAGLLPLLGLAVPTLGAIPMGLPSMALVPLKASMLGDVLLTALSLAFLGAIDSLLTSLVADSMTSSFHDSNRELVGQGVGNIFAGLFGGNAGAGATMRTVVNVRTGGRTPISGAAHSVVLLAFVLGLGSLARYVPLSCLAAILIKSGLDVVDWDLLKQGRKLPLAETAILSVTFLMTMFVDLIVAVVAGWALAVFLLFFKSSQLQLGQNGVEVFEAADAASAPGAVKEVLDATGDKKATVVLLKGQVAFGAATSLLRDLLPKLLGREVVVLDLSGVQLIDTSAVLSMEELLMKVQDAGGSTYVCGASKGMEGYALLDGLGLAGRAKNASVDDGLAAGLLAA